MARLLIEETELNEALADELFYDLKVELPYQKEAVAKRLVELREKENDWRKLDLANQNVKDWSFDREDVVNFSTSILKTKTSSSEINESALAAIQAQLASAPDDQNALFIAGAAEFRLGRNDQANETLQRAVRLSQEGKEPWWFGMLFLAMAKHQAGDADAALQTIFSRGNFASGGTSPPGSKLLSPPSVSTPPLRACPAGAQVYLANTPAALQPLLALFKDPGELVSPVNQFPQIQYHHELGDHHSRFVRTTFMLYAPNVPT